MDADETPDGLTPSVLPGLRRELFVDALLAARARFSPGEEWEAFVEAAWREAGLAFGFLERAPWPEGLELPRLTNEG